MSSKVGKQFEFHREICEKITPSLLCYVNELHYFLSDSRRF